MALDQLTSSDVGAPARAKINAAIAEVNSARDRISASVSESAKQDKALSDAINVLAASTARDFNAAAAEREKQDQVLSLALNDETLQRLAHDAKVDATTARQTSDIAGLIAGQYDFLAPRARVGEVATAFTLVASPDLIQGPDRALPIVPPANLAVGDAGPVVRITGAAVVAMRRTVAIEPGRVYQARAVRQVRTNSTDPSNDAVRVAIAWFDQNKTRLPSTAGAYILGDDLDPKAAQGRREVSGRICTIPGTGIVLVPPATARSAKLYLQTFGRDGVVDLELLEIEDVTASRLLDPVSADIAARVGGLESLNLGARLDAVESRVQAPNSLTYATRGDAAAADIPATVTTIQTRGLAQPGDGRGAVYRRVPAGTDRIDVASHDGALWQRINATINAEDIGEVTGASIGYPADLANTVRRDLDERMREQAKSFFDFLPRSVAAALLAGTTVNTDLTLYLQKALDSGRNLVMPAGLPGLTRMRITAALQQSTPYQQVYWSPVALLVYDRPRGAKAANGQPGTAVEPLWIITQPAVEAELWHFHGDHQGSLYGNPVIGGGNLGLGTALVVMAPSAYLHRPIVSNAWDNGIGVADFDLSKNVQVPGSPRGVVIFGARTYMCGIGPHDDGNADSVGAQAGGGVNNLTGSATIISDCVDSGSTTNFIQDFHGGASGFWSGCFGSGARMSTVTHMGRPAGGIGMYLAGSHSVVVGLQIEDCAGPGLIGDGSAAYVTVIGPRIKAAGMEGYRIGGVGVTLVSPRADQCSYGKPGQYPAIALFGTGDAGNGQFGPSTVHVYDPQTSGTFHSWGIELRREVGAVIGRCQGGTLNGTLGAYGPLAVRLTMPEFVFEDVRVAGEHVLRSTGLRSIDGTNTNAVAFPFGTPRSEAAGALPNGTWFLRDENDPRKQMVLGFDGDRLMGVIQSLLRGDRFVPLSLNPGGGDIEVQSVLKRVYATDGDAAAAGLGVGCLYINAATGDLRIRRS